MAIKKRHKETESPTTEKVMIDVWSKAADTLLSLFTFVAFIFDNGKLGKRDRDRDHVLAAKSLLQSLTTCPTSAV